MMNFRVWGILFLIGAAGFAVAGFLVPGARLAFAVTALAFALVGALVLWLHTFMKDVPKVTLRSGLERMAAGTVLAAQTLQDMTGQGVGGARSDIDDPVDRDERREPDGARRLASGGADRSRDPR